MTDARKGVRRGKEEAQEGRQETAVLRARAAANLARIRWSARRLVVTDGRLAAQFEVEARLRHG